MDSITSSASADSVAVDMLPSVEPIRAEDVNNVPLCGIFGERLETPQDQAKHIVSIIRSTDDVLRKFCDPLLSQIHGYRNQVDAAYSPLFQNQEDYAKIFLTNASFCNAFKQLQKFIGMEKHVLGHLGFPDKPRRR